MQNCFIQYVFITSLLFCSCGLKSQQKTKFIVDAFFSDADSIELKVAGFNLIKPASHAYDSLPIFEIDTVLSGTQAITLMLIQKEGSEIFEEKINLVGVGIVKISLREHGSGKLPAVPFRHIVVDEYGQVTLRSSSNKQEFYIDSGRGGDSGTTERIKSLDPDLKHKIVWKLNNKETCSLTDYKICSGCQKTLTCNPTTGKVTIE